MTKLNSLRRYLEKHQQLLIAPVPQKHAHRLEIYHNYLKLEIKRTEKKIEGMKK